MKQTRASDGMEMLAALCFERRGCGNLVMTGHADDKCTPIDACVHAHHAPCFGIGMDSGARPHREMAAGTRSVARSFIA
jgi:hypothetical protein